MAVSYPGLFQDGSGQVRFAGNVVFTNDTNNPTNSTGNISCVNLTATGNVALGDAAADTLGFYGHAPTAQQTGVAVTAAGIHAALVALGLITA